MVRKGGWGGQCFPEDPSTTKNINFVVCFHNPGLHACSCYWIKKVDAKVLMFLFGPFKSLEIDFSIKRPFISFKSFDSAHVSFSDRVNRYLPVEYRL